ncbi:hypothetical protein H0H92_001185 [Tricholoma furcatifolium]|nr:hypothetical protein H0H92_001185 [Tricholoma furcatifolium]
MASRDPSPYQYPYPPQRLSPNYQNPQHGYYSASPRPSHESDTGYTPKAVEEARILARTPSPTPSEERELKSGAVDWKTIRYYVALVVILVLTALITIFHTQIVDWLTPVTRWMYQLKFGWLVPIGILFCVIILLFFEQTLRDLTTDIQLFGHEIVAILCGLVWGMWIGFAIVSAGTLLGEIGNFYAFKYCCRARGEKMERTNITYACLAKVVREGGFKIALVARLSAIPGHFTTAIFSTCGMNIFVFIIAAILSMPKQFITVYLGVLLEQSATGGSISPLQEMYLRKPPNVTGVTDKKSRIISDVVLAITFLITILAMWYIYHLMSKVKPQVIYERRKARQAKLARAAASGSLSPTSSDDAMPLTLKVQAPSLHNPNRASYSSQSSGSYDHPNQGPDQGYLYAPTPHRPGVRLPSPSAMDNTDGGPVYGYVPAVRRESTDEVGWETGAGAGASHSMSAGVGVYGAPYHGTSAETLTGRESSETLTQSQPGLQARPPPGAWVGAAPGQSQDPRTLTQRVDRPEGTWERFDAGGRIGGHGVQLTDGPSPGRSEGSVSSYRTASQGDGDEFGGDAHAQVPRLPDPRDPFSGGSDMSVKLVNPRSAASPPPPSYISDLR